MKNSTKKRILKYKKISFSKLIHNKIITNGKEKKYINFIHKVTHWPWLILNKKMKNSKIILFLSLKKTKEFKKSAYKWIKVFFYVSLQTLSKNYNSSTLYTKCIRKKKLSQIISLILMQTKKYTQKNRIQDMDIFRKKFSKLNEIVSVSLLCVWYW